MCQIFAGQDPENYSYVSRSIRLDGQVTSIRLEGLYWSILDEVAESHKVLRRQGLSRSCTVRLWTFRARHKTSPHCYALRA